MQCRTSNCDNDGTAKQQIRLKSADDALIIRKETLKNPLQMRTVPVYLEKSMKFV